MPKMARRRFVASSAALTAVGLLARPSQANAQKPGVEVSLDKRQRAEVALKHRQQRTFRQSRLKGRPPAILSTPPDSRTPCDVL